MTTMSVHTPTTAATPARLLNTPSSKARGHHRSNGYDLYNFDPIEKAWQMGEPAIPEMSYRQPTQHWSDVTDGPDAQQHALHGNKYLASDNRTCLHEACRRVIAAIASTQNMPTNPRRTLNPFYTYDSKAGDAPSEWVQARRAGTKTLSLDMPVAGSTDITLGDTIPDDFDGTAPYTMQDPETRDQIEWEREAYYSGPVTRYRRKMSQNTGADFVAIDRWGDWASKEDITVLNRNGRALTKEQGKALPFARCGYRRVLTPEPIWKNAKDLVETDFEVAFVFEAQTRINYPAVVNSYIKRIRELTGSFPKWEEQRRMAREGAQERLERQVKPPRCPIEFQLDRDPFRFRFIDELLHEPHDLIDVDSLVPIWIAMTKPDVIRDSEGNRFRLTQYPPKERTRLENLMTSELAVEDIMDIEQEIIAYLRDHNSVEYFTKHAIRNHPNSVIAAKSRQHSNGAEFLAGLPDAIEDRVNTNAPTWASAKA